ncbi:reverse transcriptase domain-containing protein [Streptomyces sp. NPDC001410]|uniref:reverse transcriptase domain-containing protein n=1 Tax=Streptomyces sp. NPDC001410 TaxID=3364574 RepID=UPI003685A7C4
MSGHPDPAGPRRADGSQAGPGADFRGRYPSSYGYRPGRRSQDAIAEIHRFTRKPSTYDWVIEGDIKACFDNVDHHVLMDLAAERIKDRKVLRLVSAFLRAGVVELHGGFAETSRAVRKEESPPRC